MGHLRLVKRPTRTDRVREALLEALAQHERVIEAYPGLDRVELSVRFPRDGGAPLVAVDVRGRPRQAVI